MQYSLVNNFFAENGRGAEFSGFGNFGEYRYKLWRVWDNKLPLAMCVGLNPSTANSDKDDATIRTLSSMLKKLGYGGFYMVNLFAYKGSKPTVLLGVKDPVGPQNDEKIKAASILCKDVIICWGNVDKRFYDRVLAVLNAYPDAFCFGVNKNGTPMHPMAMMYAGTMHAPKLCRYADC
jgi:hypothetical protein